MTSKIPVELPTILIVCKECNSKIVDVSLEEHLISRMGNQNYRMIRSKSGVIGLIYELGSLYGTIKFLEEN